MPGVLITNVLITDASTEYEDKGTFINGEDQREFTVPNISQKEHTARVRIDYKITSDAFNSSDFIILNI